MPQAVAVTRHRSWGVVVLTILSVLAGIYALFDAARYMGWMPTSIETALGEYKFVLPDQYWLGAILAVVVAAIWFLVAYWLWNLNPSGWLFVVIISILNLVMLGLALLGKSTFWGIFGQLVINALVLIIAFMPGTKASFGQD